MTDIAIRGLEFVNTRADVSRFASVIVPAAAVTVGLFMAMQALVKVDDFSPPNATVYDLEPYMAKSEIEIERPVTVKPLKIDDLTAPPSTPPLVKTLNTVDLSGVNFSGEASSDYAEPDLGGVKPISMTSVIDRTALPLAPPVVQYPIRALEQGIQGRCDVFLSVSPKGEPFDVQAKCTDRVFKTAAEKAVRKSKFAPKIKHGRALTVTGVVYPIEFKMEP